MVYRLKEIIWNGVIVESEKHIISIRIYSSAWTYKFGIDIDNLYSFYCSNSESVNTILNNLDREEVFAYIKAMCKLNWIRKRELAERLVTRIELDDLESAYEELAKSLYYSFYYYLYLHEDPKVKDEFLDIFSELEKYSASCRYWKRKLENVNAILKVQKHKFRKIAEEFGRKE
jgi:hypothetical protein